VGRVPGSRPTSPQPSDQHQSPGPDQWRGGALTQQSLGIGGSFVPTTPFERHLGELPDHAPKVQILVALFEEGQRFGPMSVDDVVPPQITAGLD
jgi:hypothetical protein